MRNTITLAAFAAGALAVPYNMKRDIVTNVEMVYVTNVVTVTAEGAAPTPAKHYGHHNVHSVEITSAAPVYVAPTSTPEAQPTYEAPVVSAPVVSTPSVAYSAPASAPTDYQGTVVYHHNLHRANHSAPDIVWDDALAACAQTIAASCMYAHNTEVDGGGYGQNIAAGVDSGNISSVITDMFYNGEEPYYSSNYGMDDPDMTYFENWGHFSQIVWKSTTSVGCATQYCPSGLGNVGGGVSPYFTVCNYKGPGNFAGEYAANVGSPLGHPTVNWNAGL